MKAIVRVRQGYHAMYYKFDDEMSAIQFATISKERAMDAVDRDGIVTKTLVSVILNPDENDIED